MPRSNEHFSPDNEDMDDIMGNADVTGLHDDIDPDLDDIMGNADVTGLHDDIDLDLDDMMGNADVTGLHDDIHQNMDDVMDNADLTGPHDDIELQYSISQASIDKIDLPSKFNESDTEEQEELLIIRPTDDKIGAKATTNNLSDARSYSLNATAPINSRPSSIQKNANRKLSYTSPANNQPNFHENMDGDDVSENESDIKVSREPINNKFVKARYENAKNEENDDNNLESENLDFLMNSNNFDGEYGNNEDIDGIRDEGENIENFVDEEGEEEEREEEEEEEEAEEEGGVGEYNNMDRSVSEKDENSIESDFDQVHANNSSRKVAKGKSKKKRQGAELEGMPYQHEANKPQFQVGNKSISISEAKLFGLLAKDGKTLRVGPPSTEESLKMIEDNKEKTAKVNLLSQTGDKDYSHLEEPKPSFKPSRSKEAERAMRDKKCGYDFVDRLKEKGDFLDRIQKDGMKKMTGGGKYSKSQLEAMELDYIAMPDKLACPICKADQTFAEFIEKSRECTKCKIKFEKLNTTSGVGFMKNLQKNEAKRLEKLKAIERDMYSDHLKPKNERKDGATTLPPIKGADNRPDSPLPLPPVPIKAVAAKPYSQQSSLYSNGQNLSKPQGKGQNENARDISSKEPKSALEVQLERYPDISAFISNSSTTKVSKGEEKKAKAKGFDRLAE